jgi:hypothetical protein
MTNCDVDAVGNLAHCHDEAIVTSTTKGGGWSRPYRIELMYTAGGEHHDAYTETLQTFGYKQEMLVPLSGGLTLSSMKRVHEYVWVGGGAGFESMPTWKRDTDGLYPQTFDITTYTLAPAIRAEAPLTPDGHLLRVYAYSQLAAGLGIGHTKHHDQDDMLTTDTYFGPALQFMAGVRLGGERLGVSIGYGFSYAHVVDNLIGDTHNSGGHRFTLSAAYGF